MPSATSKDLRRRNRSAVLRRVVLGGESTRADLAAECGMSAGTAATVVNELIAEGLLQEVGHHPSGGGRPTARVGVVPGGAHVVGADFGEEWITIRLFDLSLKRRAEVRAEFDRRTVSAAKVAAAVNDALDRFRAGHPDRMRTLAGVGLGLPGIVRHQPDGEATLHAPALRWAPVPIGEAFDLGGVPVFADNVAKTLTRAEHWLGAARGADEAAVVLVGRGIGAGLVIGGRLVQGRSGTAGEWGHTKISVGGPLCRCGARGCLEAHVGADAIVRRWLPGADSEAAGRNAMDRLLRAAAEGDAWAARVLDDAVQVLGLGLANLVNGLNPQKVVVGGWLGQRLMAVRGRELERAVRACSLTLPGEDVEVVGTALGDEAVTLGSALLPLAWMIDGDAAAAGAVVRRTAASPGFGPATGPGPAARTTPPRGSHRGATLSHHRAAKSFTTDSALSE